MAQKKFQELNLKDAFLFAAALSDEEICRLILEIILGHPVGHMKIHTEHPLLYHSDFRSVRLDIYVTEKDQINYDLEMQNKNKQSDAKMSLPKRSRYYQACVDATSLKPGENIADLKPVNIIFICTFDPFSEGLYQYTFDERCLENDFPLQDGVRKIFLCTKGIHTEGVPQGLIEFLHYLEDSSDACAAQATDSRIKVIHQKVTELKKSRELEEYYMTVEEYLRDEVEEAREEAKKEGRAEGKAEGREEGRAEGRKEGETRLSKLVACMVEAGDNKHLVDLCKDSVYLKKMYEKYHL